jgi:hypothetical protein
MVPRSSAPSTAAADGQWVGLKYCFAASPDIQSID